MQDTFDDYFRDSGWHAELRAIVASVLCRRDQDPSFSKVLTHVEGKLREKWSEVENWKAFARIVARRKAIKLGSSRKEQETTGVDPNAASLLASTSATGTIQPFDEANRSEQMERLKRDFENLPPEEQRIVSAWLASNCIFKKAAENLGMPESSFRVRFMKTIIPKLQRSFE